MITLPTIDERQAATKHGRPPIFYFSTTSFNLAGLDQWLDNLCHVNSIDSFDEQQPKTLVPNDPQLARITGFEATVNALLTDEETAAFVRAQGPGGKALCLMFDDKTESLARGLGLELCLPSARLRARLDNKVTATRLAGRAGVRSVPHVLAKIDNYATLRQVSAGLGPDLVIQLPYGDSGSTTFFVSSEAEFHRHAGQIVAEREVKVMRRIKPRQATIEGCITRHGTLVGPLITELVGFPALTPHPGGWCGNEVFSETESDVLSPDIRYQAQQATIAIGAQMRQAGYRGYFGLDFLIDQETETLYFGELNPRITGATPMTTLLANDQQAVPLFVHHLLEWLDVDWSVDVDQYNQQWLRPERGTGWSQIILEHTNDTAKTIADAPPSGIWQLGQDGDIHFDRADDDPQAVGHEGEAFFLRTIGSGQTPRKGSALGRLLTRGRLMTDGYRLTARANAWIRGLRREFGLT